MRHFTVALVGSNPTFTDKSTRDELNTSLYDNKEDGTSFAMASIVFHSK